MPLIITAGVDRNAQFTLRELLSPSSYSILEAEDGESCLTAVSQAKPDLLLLDGDLLLGDGTSVCARLRTEYPRLPILMILHDADDAQAAFDMGATDVIMHVTQTAVLRHRVARLLEASQYVQLQERDAWYQSMIENAIEGIFRSTTDGHFLLVNPALVRMLGYTSAEEVLSLNLNYDLHATPDQRAHIIALLEKSESAVFEAIWKHKHGGFITVRIHGRAVRDADGSIVYYEGQALDITEQKQAETALFQSQRELQVRTESLETINMIADTVYESLDLDIVLETALFAVMNYLDVPGASLYMVDEPTDTLRRVATRGVSKGLSAAAAVLPLENSVNGEAVATRDIVISEDPSQDKRIRPNIRQELAAANIQQIVVIPLLFREKVTGTLSLPLNSRRHLTHQECTTLLSVGKTIGLAVANAQYVSRIETEGHERLRAELAEHEQRVLAEALRDTAAVLSSALNQDEVLERILNSVSRVVHCDMANIYLIDEDGIASSVRSIGYAEFAYELESAALRVNVNETPNLQRVAKTGMPRVINDTYDNPDWVTFPETAWIRSCVSAPIQIDGRVMGFLNLDSAVPNTFDQQDADTLKIFADQAGIAIRNAQLYDAVRKHADLLEQRVAERASELAIERAQLRAILDSMADGVLGVLYDERLTSQNIWSLRPSYRYINQALYRLLGYSDEEWNDTFLQGLNMTRDTSQAIQASFVNSLIQDGYWRGDVHLWRKDGTEFDASLRSTAIKDTDGGVVGSITLFRDISQEKELERQRTRFISNAAHELRTPITNLKTRLYLARKQPERLATHLQILEQVTDHMKDLAEYLLDLSRIERGTLQLRRENFYLEHFLSEIVSIQRPEAEKNGLTMNLEMPSESLMLNADPGRINQVITNLLSNAIRHTANGGRITIEVVRGDEDHADWIDIHVRDTGRGIKPEYLPHIFEPFYQANQSASGVGLGLSISKEIIDMHGGYISVTSTVGVGTCFVISLPLAE